MFKSIKLLLVLAILSVSALCWSNSAAADDAPSTVIVLPKFVYGQPASTTSPSSTLQTQPQLQPSLQPTVTPDYVIAPGDVLQVTVWKEDGLDQEVLVLPDGTMTFPLIGSLQAAGESPAVLQAAIKKKLSTLIPDAAVTVMVKAALGHTVSVIGQVTKPGELVMGHYLTVMQALSQAGGLTPYASEDHIIILRRADGAEKSIPFPYKDIISGDELDKDITLNPGDVVVVPTAGLL